MSDSSINRIATVVDMIEMHDPPYPGLTLRDDVLPALGRQVGQAVARRKFGWLIKPRLTSGRCIRR